MSVDHIDEGLLLRRARGAASADVDGDLVLISPVDRRCFALNGTAAAVWETLPPANGAGVGLDAILERLRSVYDVEGHPFDTEVAALLRKMIDAGVVTASD